MCDRCGCSKPAVDVRIDGERALQDGSMCPREIILRKAILAKNERLSRGIRHYFERRQILALNILSSPGAGKTALLERTLTMADDRLPGAAVVGDLATENDAIRLRRSGAPVVQVATGNVCHLDAEMVAAAIARLDLEGVKLLAIENVGNLVCPAAYDLGEAARIVLLSTTEGEDKPLKYPAIFKRADVVIVNKIDLVEAVTYDRQAAATNIQHIAPQAKILEVSARTGAGLDDWVCHLEAMYRAKFLEATPELRAKECVSSQERIAYLED